MKLLVFAHTPPPHHGQSYMVQLMLQGFGGDQRRAGPVKRSAKSFNIESFHVNARLSKKLEDIGDMRSGKFFLILGYCFQAVWCRLRYGVTNFYYIPAPGKRSALYRDWLVMAICRRFFKRFILHWHAAGLAKWLETSVQIRTRALTYRFMKGADLNIVLSQYNRADAEKLFGQRITVVSNGIPDPCPDFEREVLPRRVARFVARRRLLAQGAIGAAEPRMLCSILYLAHCTREKGLFDTVAGVALANRQLESRGAGISLRLVVTGNFVTTAEKEQFDRMTAQPGVRGIVEYLGFVSGEQQTLLLPEADLFCFPTYYQNENQPVNLIEALAFGLPILTTRWRSLPELFPANYPGRVAIHSPDQIAEAIVTLLSGESGEGFREIFLRNFTIGRHLSGLSEAFRKLEQPGAQASPARLAEARPRS